MCLVFEHGWPESQRSSKASDDNYNQQVTKLKKLGRVHTHTMHACAHTRQRERGLERSLVKISTHSTQSTVHTSYRFLNFKMVLLVCRT